MKSIPKNNISKRLNRKMTTAEKSHFSSKNIPYTEVIRQINIAEDMIELIIETSLRKDLKHLNKTV